MSIFSIKLKGKRPFAFKETKGTRTFTPNKGQRHLGNDQRGEKHN